MSTRSAARTQSAGPAEPSLGARAIRARWIAFRNGLIANPNFQRWAARFPLTRPIARRRAAALFDICAGFVYSQILFACVQSDLFGFLARGPRTLDAIAAKLALPRDTALKLLRAAASLDLIAEIDPENYTLGDLGAALLGNPGIAAMTTHHSLLYDDLRDPLALFRNDVHETKLGQFWAYASNENDMAGDAEVAGYSALMTASHAFVTEDVLASYPFARHAHLLDIGGGEGSFAIAAARLTPALRVTLFDLPPVAARAQARIAKADLGGRIVTKGGDFFADPLPPDADLATLVRIAHDHDDASVALLLANIRRALHDDGVLLIAEPMSGVAGAERAADAYFAFYLRAMGRGRPRTPSEFEKLLRSVGFGRIDCLRTPRPMLTSLIAARR